MSHTQQGERAHQTRIYSRWKKESFVKVLQLIKFSHIVLYIHIVPLVGLESRLEHFGL